MLLSALRRPPRAAAPARNQPTPGPSSPDEGHPTASRPESGSIPGVPTYQRRWQVVLAVAIVGGPLAYLLGGLLAPAIHDSGQASIAANAAANPTSNALHLAAFVLASYLLPIGAIGLAGLAYPRAPWLATIGGLLAVVGCLPHSALTAWTTSPAPWPACPAAPPPPTCWTASAPTR